MSDISDVIEIIEILETSYIAFIAYDCICSFVGDTTSPMSSHARRNLSTNSMSSSCSGFIAMTAVILSHLLLDKVNLLLLWSRNSFELVLCFDLFHHHSILSNGIIHKCQIIFPSHHEQSDHHYS